MVEVQQDVENEDETKTLQAPAEYRDGRGRFTAGNPYGNGSSRTMAYRRAIQNSIPPERIVQWLNEAAAQAESSGSWRGTLAVAQVALTFGIGKPRMQQNEVEGRPSLQFLLDLIPDEVVARPVEAQAPTASALRQ